ncbi:methyltransferase [Kribbella solani]|uniref:O-methyltransferase C-terminal domain-containing protein n=1 Tax=Kribbella solani TaxID=236067 RepID=A0A841DQV2_9ACTN|nr:methyltransferase [Kribbella solani]MBB5977788.1 hypothetical protein [Kribbella solani]
MTAPDWNDWPELRRPGFDTSYNIMLFHLVPAIARAGIETGILEALNLAPRTASELSSSLALDSQAVEMFLSAAESIDLCRPTGDCWSLGSLGRLFSQDHPSESATALTAYAEPWHWANSQLWQEAAQSMRTGQDAFRLIHGRGLFETLAAEPTLRRSFDAYTDNRTEHSLADVVAGLDLKAGETLVDVGGGYSRLAAHAVEKYGVGAFVFDTPEVVREAVSRTGDKSQAQFVGGDFFVDDLPAGDVYTLKEVVHNWNDEQAVALLRNVGRAMPVGSRIAIVEQFRSAASGHRNALLSFGMFLAFGGRQRTSEQLDTLLAAAGFEPSRAVGIRHSTFDVLIARKL